MVKVTIEATGEETQVLTGEETQVLTGDMVNLAMIDKRGCKIALFCNQEEDVHPEKFIKSMVHLVENSIKAYAQNDNEVESMLSMCFALEMKSAREQKLQEEMKEERHDIEKEAIDGLEDFIKILRKVVEE